MPIELQEKLKAAAGIARKPSLREYILHALALHVKDLERKGYTLSPKGKLREGAFLSVFCPYTDQYLQRLGAIGSTLFLLLTHCPNSCT